MNPRNHRFPCALLFLVFLLVGTLAQAGETPAPAPAPDPPSPESVAESFFRALKSGQYSTAVELMHPEALEKFRTMILPIVEESASGEDPTENMLPLFRGVTDIAALKKLSPAEFFAAFFRDLTDASPELKEALASGSMTAVGSVLEGDVVHVVCRTAVSMQGVSVSKMDVISLKRSSGNWLLLLSAEMEGIAQSLRNSRSGKS